MTRDASPADSRPSTALSRSPWFIVGPGALGCLFAARLVEVMPLRLVGRTLRETPYRYRSPQGITQRISLPRLSVAQLAGAPPPALVIIATKAYAAEEALTSLAPHIAATTPLLLLQNGFDVQPRLTQQWTGPVLCATTTEGAYRDGPDSVIHAGHGQTWIGHLEGRHARLARRVAETLRAADFSAAACDDIRVRLWHKLGVNAAINPLVARFGIHNGKLRDAAFRPQVEALIDDIVSVMAAEAIPPPEAGWRALIWSVVEGTANNRASMLQDVLAGRRTERDAILGPLLEAAARHGLEVPALTELYRTTPA
ncbi:ketopantoate reductase family protein [Halomonas sp. WWR20]